MPIPLYFHDTSEEADICLRLSSLQKHDLNLERSGRYWAIVDCVLVEVGDISRPVLHSLSRGARAAKLD